MLLFTSNPLSPTLIVSTRSKPSPSPTLNLYLGSKIEDADIKHLAAWDDAMARHPTSYAPIVAQYQTLFILKSSTIRLGHVDSGRSQERSAAAQTAYSYLTLHHGVYEGQVQEMLCVRVDFTRSFAAIMVMTLLCKSAQ
jgi:hypothetical protein